MTQTISIIADEPMFIVSDNPDIVVTVSGSGIRGPSNFHIGNTAPTDTPAGSAVLWVKSGLGANNDQYGLYLIVGG